MMRGEMSVATDAVESPAPPLDAAAPAYRAQREAHWNAIAARSDRWHGVGGYYHRRLEEIYQFLIPPGQRVLEIGCGRGDLLGAVKPSVGVGIDFSAEMIERARKRHPEMRFVQADAHELSLDQTFDFVILSDVVNDLWDVQTVIEQLRAVCTPRTRVILNLYSHLWEWPLRLAQKANLARPTLPQNWLTVADLANLMRLAGFEVMRNWEEVLWPVATPIVDRVCNSFFGEALAVSVGGADEFRDRPAGGESRKNECMVTGGDHANRGAGADSFGDRAGAERGGEHRADFSAHAGAGRGTELVFVEGTRRMKRTWPSSAPSRRIRIGGRNSCDRRAEARAMLCGSGSLRRVGMCS
jgi:SAM-dependent methyltransferase